MRSQVRARRAADPDFEPEEYDEDEEDEDEAEEDEDDEDERGDGQKWYVAGQEPIAHGMCRGA